MSEANILEVKFPRLASLREQAGSANRAGSYFQGLEDKIRQSPLADEYYTALEEELSQLSDEAWGQLRRKCARYVCAPHKERAWEQLFSVLNESKGYLFLKQLGYVDIHFLPEEKQKHPTPDLEASGGDDRDAVLEVKTIQRSDEYHQYLEDQNARFSEGRLPMVRECSSELPRGLASKFVSMLGRAEKQLLEYRSTDSLRRFAMLVVGIDDDPDVPPAFKDIDQGLRDLAKEHRSEEIVVVIHRPYEVSVVN